jgi:hypothetical protein
MLTLSFLSTVSRKNFVSVTDFIAEPDSRAQCAALEENVKEFGLTYFGMKDRRQGMRNLLVLCECFPHRFDQALSMLSGRNKVSL